MQQKARVFERSMMPVAKQRAQSEEASTCNESAGANRTIIVTLVISSISLFCGYVAGTTQSLSSFQLANQARAAAITLHNQSPVILKYVTPIKSRIELCLLLQQEGFEVGAELGVQRGHFASETLQRWPKCRRYYLVDIWAPQDNYKDYANVDQAEQDKILAQARQVLTPWQHKLVWLRMRTTQAVRHIREPLDYVYVDARHDYCGTLEDIQAWWPLIRPGGIMAGHDYENAPEVMQATGQDWALCSNGTIHQGAVQSAVNEFFAAQGVQVVVTYREDAWNTWIARKP